MRRMSKGKMWIFALGQLGWSMLGCIVINWLVYFYQPDAAAVEAGQTVFIPQGMTVFGIATVIGAITALSRIFDAVTDPMIASLSDRSRNPRGRRIPFMRAASIPFAVCTALIFWMPVNGTSDYNSLWLTVILLLFYLFMTAYCTPYNALIPEFGRTQEDRVNISTFISFTYFLGSAAAYGAPYIWTELTPALGRVGAIRATFAGMAVVALFFLLLPTFCIREKDYADVRPVESDVFSSLNKTFKNKQFRVFVGSDVLYWIALTIFQTGLPFFITALMGLDETMTTTLYVAMTAASIVCYAPVNALAKRASKKKLVLYGYGGLTLVYIVTAASGLLGGDGMVYGLVIVALAAFPMALLGILPQAIVADIAQSDGIQTGESRDGMFYAARTFAFKMGQSLAMLLFTALASVGGGATGYRVAAVVAAVLCTLGALVMGKYDEKKVLKTFEALQ